MPGVQLNYSPFPWAGERNRNSGTEVSPTPLSKETVQTLPGLLWEGGGGIFTWQRRAGPALVLAGGWLRGTSLCQGLVETGDLLAVAQCSSSGPAAVTVTTRVRACITMRGVNLVFFPCPLKIMHSLKMRKAPSPPPPFYLLVAKASNLPNIFKHLDFKRCCFDDIIVWLVANPQGSYQHHKPHL